jgi:hypothetical protein
MVFLSPFTKIPSWDSSHHSLLSDPLRFFIYLSFNHQTPYSLTLQTPNLNIIHAGGSTFHVWARVILDASLGIATGYSYGRQRQAVVRVPGGTRFFSSQRCENHFWTPPDFLTNQWEPVGSYCGGKTAGAWSSPLTSNYLSHKRPWTH